MSCNITSGISTGCNDQVGGIIGIHYFTWTSDLVVDKDANGVITRVYRGGNPGSNIFWDFIDCTNSTGNVTETYNVNSNGSILGFHQSAQFFMPTTATPLGPPLYNFIQNIASQNNLVIGIETGSNGPMQGYSKKCFVFGLDRPAYCVGGSKQTGITYNDNNGYTMELGADSKTPMEEIAFMAMHSNNLRCDSQNPQMGSGNSFNLEPLLNYEGGNIIETVPGNGVYYAISLQREELITVEAVITADWTADAFSGTNFLVTWGMAGTFSSTPLTYTNLTQYPLPTAPGIASIQVKGTYLNSDFLNQVRNITPIKVTGPYPGIITAPGYVPTAKFLTITRTT